MSDFVIIEKVFLFKILGVGINVQTRLGISLSINESTFCNEFYYSYDLEIDHETLNEIGQRAFSELSNVSSRFSQYIEDHNLDARAFSTPEELKQKIIETREKLQEPSHS